MSKTGIPASITGIHIKETTRRDLELLHCHGHCQCSLIKMSEDEYYFNRCSVSQYPDIESVRSKSRLSTPIGLNLEPCLSYLPDGNPTPKDIEPEGAFKALQDKGIKITSYDERDGAGRPLKRNRWT
jgi:hypothetical protein